MSSAVIVFKDLNDSNKALNLIIFSDFSLNAIVFVPSLYQQFFLLLSEFILF
jgi:hypothetical protein